MAFHDIKLLRIADGYAFIVCVLQLILLKNDAPPLSSHEKHLLVLHSPRPNYPKIACKWSNAHGR